MKVKCIANTRQDLLQTTLERADNTIMEEKAPLKIGEVYTVYSQNITKGVLCYLLIGTYENLPSWYPAELFDIMDNQIYFEWYYRFNLELPISALWGYFEMILIENHYYDLLEREEEAVKIFLQRKKEIDEFN